jgi:hypothetical protein
MIEIFASSNLERVGQLLGLLRDDIERARKSASTATVKWAEREAAKGLARETGVPYRAARIRTWKKIRINSGGSVTLGLNPISAKYLPGRRRRDSFTNKKLNAHPFRRLGTKRLPIERVEVEIEQQGTQFAEGEFVLAIQEHLVEEFFARLDKVSGRTAGTAKAIMT